MRVTLSTGLAHTWFPAQELLPGKTEMFAVYCIYAPETLQ